MSEKKAMRRLRFCMLESEYQEFLKAYDSTIYRSISSYARKLLLGKTVKVIYRNRSQDDFIEMAVQMRKELKLIASKDPLTPWEKSELQKRLDSIEKNLIKIVELCSQK